MKIHNLTGALVIGAILEIVIVLIWFGKYRDPSQLILFLGAGILLFIFAYIYEWMKRFQGSLKKQDEKIAIQNRNILEIQRWITDKEKETD